MRIQAIAKPGGLWVPWPGKLPEGSTVELDVIEVIPADEAVNNQSNSPETVPLLTNKPTASLPNNSVDVETLDRLLDRLYGTVKYTSADKSDKEILAEVLSEKYA